MPSLDKALGLHEAALMIRAQRMEVLSSNLANADTPNYKARDLDFKAVLSSYQSSATPASALKTTHSNHLQQSGGVMSGQLQYRNPMQPSIDGNTVDTQVEKAKFMENALHYQATLNFIDGRISGLRKALRGD
jgi:flagellar basal-body rod protein FlgB